MQTDGAFINVLVVQHHERIMTGDDEAYDLRCDPRAMHEHRAEIIVSSSINMMDDEEHK